VFLVLLLALPAFAGESVSVDDHILSIFYDLWNDSAFGRDPNRTERAGWLIRHERSEYSCVRWKTSGERNHEFWRGPVPPNAIAQIHTHTVIADPRPSRKDIELTRRIGLQMFVVSGSGVWSVLPDGKIVQVSNSDWWKPYR